MTTERDIELSAEEASNLWFIPQQPGGKIVPEHVQQSLEAKGIATGIRADGRRWLTMFGDAVRRGAVQVAVKG